MKKINSKADYDQVMEKLDELMAKGSQNVTHEELEQIRTLALSAQTYEQNIYILDAIK